MWRKPLIRVGEFFKSKFFVNALLTVYGASGGVTIIVSVYTNVTGSPKLPFDIALDAFITFLWFFSFFIVTNLFFQGLGNLLIWLGNYYPNWYYLPRLNTPPHITHDNKIEVAIRNPKKDQRLAINVLYGHLESWGKYPSNSITNGIAPAHMRELLPLSTMTGKDAMIVQIGRVEDDSAKLSTGKNSNDVFTLTEPGVYAYYLEIIGIFRGRNYKGQSKINILISKDRKIIVEEG